MEYTRENAGGQFLLHRKPGGCYSQDGADLGRGDSEQMYAFGSSEAREYFLRSEDSRALAAKSERALHGLRRSLVNCVMPSGRLRKKRLLEIIEEAKRQLSATEKI